MTKANSSEERRVRDNWPEAVEKGLAANARARHMVDQIISGKRRKPISQEAMLQIAARLSQCLAAELRAFADLERILMTNDTIDDEKI